MDKYLKTYALSERNVALFGDDFLALAKMVTSGFAGLLVVLCLGIFANLDTISNFNGFQRTFLFLFSVLLTVTVLFLSLCTLFIVIIRALNVQMIGYDQEGVTKPNELVRYYQADLNSVRITGLISIFLSGICLFLLPCVVGICVF